jgi:hypothetical protein
MSDSNIGVRQFILALVSAVLLFTIARYPMVTHAPGQMDEQWFAVPGLTVWREGIPRIPYCPTRRRETFFENADKCLFALPPLLHYAQAPFFGLFEAGYPTARLPLFLSGIAGLALMGGLTRRLVSSPWAFGFALAMLAVSRPLMFTSITARPDLLAAVFGWGALLTMEKWHADTRHRWLVIAGLLCGLGLLSHPFAVVFCLQCGFWALLKTGPAPLRFSRAALLTFVALSTLSAWLPLIVKFPYEFQSQFFSNVLERSGTGIIGRIVWPWPSFRQHWEHQLAFNQPAQFVFLLVGMVAGSLSWFRQSITASQTRYLLLVWSAVFLTATTAGVHPTDGYWVFAIGLIYPLAVDVLFRWTKGAFWSIMLGGVLMLMMIPGSGIRTTLAYLNHWRSPDYHAGEFIAEVLAELPKEGLFMSDVSFVFDVYLSGRDTILCQPSQHFWGSDKPKIQYLLTGQEGEDFFARDDYQTKLLKQAGNREAMHQCWVNVSVPASSQAVDER